MMEPQIQIMKFYCYILPNVILSPFLNLCDIVLKQLKQFNKINHLLSLSKINLLLFRSSGHQCSCLCYWQANQSRWYPWSYFSYWEGCVPRNRELHHGGQLYGNYRVHTWLGR